MRLVGRTIAVVLGLWHGQAAVQNALDILATTDVAPELRPFAAKNCELVGKLLKPIKPSRATIVYLVGGAAAMEAVVASAFIVSAVRGIRSEFGFAIALTLFGAFFVIDDAFDDYDLGADHRAIFTLFAAAYAASRS
jgi:hypothetical protein